MTGPMAGRHSKRRGPACAGPWITFGPTCGRLQSSKEGRKALLGAGSPARPTDGEWGKNSPNRWGQNNNPARVAGHKSGSCRMSSHRRPGVLARVLRLPRSPKGVVPAQRPPGIELVDARTRVAHWVSPDELLAGRARGDYEAFCGARFLAASLTDPGLRSQRCVDHHAVRAVGALRDSPVPAPAESPTVPGVLCGVRASRCRVRAVDSGWPRRLSDAEGDDPPGVLKARCGALLLSGAPRQDQPPPGLRCAPCQVIFQADATAASREDSPTPGSRECAP